jgi:3',5'-cyclic AMP phosphodiesterase CpdA
MPVAARVLYMPSIGNHEYEGDLGVSSYLGRFALPNNERWYSFDWGNTHIVSLDTESEYTSDSDQLGWLESDLASASTDRNTDWIVVFFHAPPYSASPERGSNLSVRNSISPLLETYEVDVVFNGHAHVHERSYPIQREVVVDTDPKVYKDPTGIIYVVTGGGGALLYRSGSEYWTASSRSIYHYVKVDILVDTILAGSSYR